MKVTNYYTTHGEPEAEIIRDIDGKVMDVFYCGNPITFKRRFCERHDIPWIMMPAEKEPS